MRCSGRPRATSLKVLFRFAGKRSLAQITTFDFVLLLAFGESSQQALLGTDFSLPNAFVIILTLLGIDFALWVLKGKMPPLEKLIDAVPLVLVEGRLLTERMVRARVDENAILASARQSPGLERMDQIESAVLERHGGISMVPKQAN